MEKDMTLLDHAMESEMSYSEMGWKYYKGETEEGQPDYAKAVEYFEKARKADATTEADILLPLARAYRESGKTIQAIHWFKHAISEYGMTEAEEELMTLYQTGAAGKDLKEKADQYMDAKKKAKKEQEMQALFEKDEAKQAKYTESFLDSLNYLLSFEQTYVDFLNSTRPIKVPELKKGLFGGNKKEVERIQKQNADNEALRKSEAEMYESDKADLLKEKERLGIKDKLFFEYPLVTENARYCVQGFRKDLDSRGISKNYSLYSFGNEQALEFYLFDEGYDGKALHAAATYEAGELLLFMADEQGKVINQNHPDGKNIRIYTGQGAFYNPRTVTFNYLNKLLDDPRFMLLHWDWEYFKEHQDERYTLKYLWDYDYRDVSNYRYALSVEESLDMYYRAAKDLTNYYANMTDNYHDSMRQYFTDNVLKGLGGTDEADFYDERYMKKALLVYAENRIVAIAIPKKEAEVIVIHGKLRQIKLDINHGKPARFNELESIALEKGTAWEYYVATTIHYIAIHMAKQMKPVDGTEVKPIGLPDKLWRLWLRARFANQSK